MISLTSGLQPAGQPLWSNRQESLELEGLDGIIKKYPVAQNQTYKPHAARAAVIVFKSA